uniref:Uncharacterized protein n=1 Tax=viral metagenome TaxID=1070528 RepID=A0A6C0H860_9ZZZZ
MSIISFLDTFLIYIFQDCCACPERECTITNIARLAPGLCERYSQFLNCDGAVSPRPGDCNKIVNRKISSDTPLLSNVLMLETVFDIKRYQDQFGKKALDKFYSVHPRLECVDIILSNFETYGLLKKIRGKYYLLGSYRQISWRAIKSLDTKYCQEYQTMFSNYSNEICQLFGVSTNQLAQCLQIIFWYFRKAIVDSIAMDCLSKYSNSVVAVSVGSTNITSDYDITLYGKKYNNVSKVINAFNQMINVVFKKPPDYVFDTNMYGVSFIKLVRNTSTLSRDYSPEQVNDSPTKERVTSELTDPDLDVDIDDFAENFTSNPIACGNMNFTYAGPENLNTSPDSVSVKLSQHIWALVKVFVNLERIQAFDEKVYEMLRRTLVEPIQNSDSSEQSTTFAKLIYAAERLQQKYESSQANYVAFIRQFNPTFGLTNTDFNNFISYINYNGSETYFSRGAFLDVVVNRQMCNQDKIQLSQDEYLDSFVENMADLMLHYHKDKYLTRSLDALKRIKLLQDAHPQITNILNTIKDIQKFCKGEKHELLDCSAFLFMYNCIVSIRLATKFFLAQYDRESTLTDKIINDLETFLDGNLTESDSLLRLSNISLNMTQPSRDSVDARDQTPISVTNLRKFKSAPDVSTS